MTDKSIYSSKYSSTNITEKEYIHRAVDSGFGPLGGKKLFRASTPGTYRLKILTRALYSCGIYILHPNLTLSCRGTWAWSERANLEIDK